MGCASSTPMVATAGSEMLKAATHVAGDVQKQGEAAVAGATETLNATLDTAKETVSSAVAGVTNELGNAFKDGTQAVDEVKHKVMEGLQLETAEQIENAAASMSRAPTPSLEADADSLKTSTPEPEIERALANSAANEEEAPPTPKPSLEELAELSTQVVETNAAEVAATATAVAATAKATEATTQAHAATVERHWQRLGDVEAEQRRPSTTEWEKLADQLAKDRKFKPYESFAHSQIQFSVYKDFTSLRDKPGHYDGHFSGNNSQSSASQSHSDLSSGHLTPGPPHRRGQRDYAKFVGSEQAASVSRASSRLSNLGVPSVRNFDFNPQRERITLPITSNVGSRVGSRVGSAVNGRRSLWARNKPEILPEESYTQPPTRRSSMSTGLGLTRNTQVYRSTSNLATSPRPTTKQRSNSRLTTPLGTSTKTNRRSSIATGMTLQPRNVRDERQVYRSTTNLAISPLPQRKQRDNLRLANSSKHQISGNRRTMEPAFKTFEPISSEELKQKSRKGTAAIETLEFLLSHTSNVLSSTLLLSTATRDSTKLHSPAKFKSQLRISPAPTPVKTATSVSSPALVCLVGTTAALGPTGSAVRQATPTTNPHTPRRLNTGQSPAANSASANSVWRRVAQQDADTPQTSTATTPKRWSSVSHTPSKWQPQAEQSFAATNTYLHAKAEQSSDKSPAISRASSRLSSNSSGTEIVIKSLSHLTTPSAVSLVSDDIVITEYESDELATALARLSTHSTQRAANRNASARLEARRTSPWLRHNNSQQHRTYSSCGLVELCSTATTQAQAQPQPQLERCDICCNEFVMK